MKKIALIYILVIGWAIGLSAATAIDMQAHIGTDEAQQAYTAYLEKQKAYYPDTTLMGEGDLLFGRLNALMGATSWIGRATYSYNTLREYYKTTDKDLNTTGKIIGYYDGRSMSGTWDNGKTYNREHTWPQSKGADKDIPMGHDMQSVRPTASAINGSRGDTPYGESGSYYDPNDIQMNNTAYRKENLGSYRGDAARVILYDYLVYGQRGKYKNALYNGEAQLLSKLGSRGVFESVYVMIKWHMQDPPSLTEMVRNDGAQTYQKNRNPFIDYPDVALRILKSDLPSKYKVYEVETTNTLTAIPNYTYTLSDGFICYLTNSNGFRPAATELNISGAEYEYKEEMGRLTIKKVTDKVTITTLSTNIYETQQRPTARKRLSNGQIVIEKDGILYNIMGQRL